MAGPYQILKRIGPLAYQMALPPSLSKLHNVFHVSQLRKYESDPSHVLEPEHIQLREDLTFNLPLVRIVDRGTKQLRNKTVPLVKVAWGSEGSEDFTWELEDHMKEAYPDLFRGNNFEDEIFKNKGRNVTSQFFPS